jgi:hypothetical protein
MAISFSSKELPLFCVHAYLSFILQHISKFSKELLTDFIMPLFFHFLPAGLRLQKRSIIFGFDGLLHLVNIFSD